GGREEGPSHEAFVGSGGNVRERPARDPQGGGGGFGEQGGVTAGIMAHFAPRESSSAARGPRRTSGLQSRETGSERGRVAPTTAETAPSRLATPRGRGPCALLAGGESSGWSGREDPRGTGIVTASGPGRQPPGAGCSRAGRWEA